LIFSFEPCWADIYIFYETNRTFFIPNRYAQRVYFSAEPISLKRNSLLFLNQFDQVMGSISSIYIDRKNFHVNQPGSPWHIGINFNEDLGRVNLKFNDLVNLDFPYINEVSIITSSKIISKTHRRRLLFIEELSDIMGSKLNVFGRGFKPIPDKYEVLAKYRYHIALENTEQANHWSEKLSDPLIAQNRVFYFGCSNILDYFSSEAVRPIDIRNPKQVADEILFEINNNHWEVARKNILSAKNKVLTDYNLINVVTSLNPEKLHEKKFPLLFRDFAYLPRKIYRKASWKFEKFWFDNVR
jgi:hypothetical protein